MAISNESLAGLCTLEELAYEIKPRNDGESGLHLHGTRGPGEFLIGYQYGFTPATDKTLPPAQYEPNTLHITDVYAWGAKGMGSIAVALTLAHASEEGYEIGRMSLVNPRMVGVVEKLGKLGVIKESYYKVIRELDPRVGLSSNDLIRSPELLAAEHASRYLEEVEIKLAVAEALGQDDREAMGAIDCVIHF